MEVEAVYKSEYRDVYKIKSKKREAYLDTLLLVIVNKFKLCNDTEKSVYLTKDNSKFYSDTFKDGLKILTKETPYLDRTLSVGTVLYYWQPVELVDKSEWQYTIKPYVNYFHGDKDTILNYLEEVIKIIKNEE